MTQTIKQKAKSIKEWLNQAHEQWKEDHKGYDLSNLPEGDEEVEQELRF